MEHYVERKECIICKTTNLRTFFKDNMSTSLSFRLMNNIASDEIFIPYNIQICMICKTIQTKYIGDIDTIYKHNHVDNYGVIKNQSTEDFSDFIHNSEITGFLEVGASTDSLAHRILSKCPDIPYFVVEKDFRNIHKTELTVFNDFVENIDIAQVPANALILSHVFEHFYDPMSILQKIMNSRNIDYIYLNHPNLQYYIQNNVHNVLNIEHTFYVENQFIIAMFENCGFKLLRSGLYKNHSIFAEFKRDKYDCMSKPLYNISSVDDMASYFDNIKHQVEYVNSTMNQHPDYTYYIWPASAHSIALFTNGLGHANLAGITDNSPNKIGKMLYGYNLKCTSLDSIILTADKQKTCIILSGAGDYLNEIQSKTNGLGVKLLFVS